MLFLLVALGFCDHHGQHGHHGHDGHHGHHDERDGYENPSKTPQSTLGAEEMEALNNLFAGIFDDVLETMFWFAINAILLCVRIALVAGAVYLIYRLAKSRGWFGEHPESSDIVLDSIDEDAIPPIVTDSSSSRPPPTLVTYQQVTNNVPTQQAPQGVTYVAYPSP